MSSNIAISTPAHDSTCIFRIIRLLIVRALPHLDSTTTSRASHSWENKRRTAVIGGICRRMIARVFHHYLPRNKASVTRPDWLQFITEAGYSRDRKLALQTSRDPPTRRDVYDARDKSNRNKSKVPRERERETTISSKLKMNRIKSESEEMNRVEFFVGNGSARRRVKFLPLFTGWSHLNDPVEHPRSILTSQ